LIQQDKICKTAFCGRVTFQPDETALTTHRPEGFATKVARRAIHQAKNMT
jgi:hypothetical protein